MGQVFTNPLPLALIAVGGAARLVAGAGGRGRLPRGGGLGHAQHVLHDPLTRRLWWLVPLQDIAGFLVWIGGFFGNTILWRGRKYYLRRDGRSSRSKANGSVQTIVFRGG